MKRLKIYQSIHFKIVLVYMLLVLIAMQIISAYFVQKVEHQLVYNFQQSIRDRVSLLENNIQEVISEVDKKANQSTKEKEQETEAEIQKSMSSFAGSLTNVREVRVVDSGGRVIGTTDNDNQQIVGQQSKDQMVRRTLLNNTKEDSVLLDKDKKQRVWVLAQPVKLQNNTRGVIYIVSEIEQVYTQVSEITSIFVKGTVFAMAITCLLGVWLARTITKPIKEMREQAVAMTRGNYSRKVKVYGVDEIGQLATAFNILTRKVQDAQASVEGESRKLSSILSYMTDGVIATDRRGKIMLINRPAADMLKINQEDAMSRPIAEVLKIESDHTYETLLEEKDSVTIDLSTKRQNYVLRANFSAIQRETGFINGVIAVLHDITEQERVDAELREFVANVSHELRTPLTSMASYLEALGDGAWKDENIAPHFIQVTQNETERMIRLVNDLLKLSRLDSGRTKIERNFVHFNSFFNQIIDRHEMSKKDSITFKRYITTEYILIEVDEDKIVQVIDNIISNAIKYSPDGGTISFYLARQGDEIKVSIRDQGMGIPADNLEKIFQRFFRVDKARSRAMGGTGLGLAISKEMIDAHGGRIWAESTEEKGTIISFTLPYDDSVEEAEEGWD
ncbi:PAS domain-containing sensor histidine kinase [Brochothrix thermosphacta]|uniref:cell wall metabolism sensor histidine kinase WalK n=1 Tax=Brochothrix thermosphacta TaxID=2756 RepID=UPI00083F6DA5|nr:cell wall metabolism sensor histidine kinase WalK [Brochothrix thermosphacta]ODJ57930.1 PAS domain-containing sensor histidine kinase [Brochothrix thermosphacta]